METCENSDTNSYIEKKSLYVPSGYSIITCYSVDKLLNEQKYYRGGDCTQKFSQDLKEIFIRLIVAPWCSGYHYYTTSFN